MILNVYSGGRRGPGAWDCWPPINCAGIANTKAMVNRLRSGKQTAIRLYASNFRARLKAATLFSSLRGNTFWYLSLNHYQNDLAGSDWISPGARCIGMGIQYTPGATC